MPGNVTTVEAIHSGMTKNYNYYPRAELERAAETWVKPYSKPVLKHHDIQSEPLGRVTAANFRRSHLKRGAYCTELVLGISDADAAQRVEDGRYSTVSVGTIVTGAICSICKNDWALGNWCEHRKGQVYENKLCYWELKIGEHVEVSFVNQPADPYAQVVDVADEAVTRAATNEGESAGTIESGKEEPRGEEYVAGVIGAFEEETPAAKSGAADESRQAADGEGEGVEELSRRLEALEAQINELAGEIKTAAAKLESALEQNVKLAGILHEELVQHYADLAVLAGLFAGREEAENEATKLEVRELRREIIRLSSEAAASRKIESVSCPGGDGQVVEQPSKGGHVYTLSDLEQALLKLLGGKQPT